MDGRTFDSFGTMKFNALHLMLALLPLLGGCYKDDVNYAKLTTNLSIPRIWARTCS